MRSHTTKLTYGRASGCLRTENGNKVAEITLQVGLAADSWGALLSSAPVMLDFLRVVLDNSEYGLNCEQVEELRNIIEGADLVRPVCRP